jgi:hypothetical protein
MVTQTFPVEVTRADETFAATPAVDAAAMVPRAAVKHETRNANR